MNPTFCLLFLTLVPSTISGAQYAYFHFEKSSITVNEGDGEISVKIVRTGDTQLGGLLRVTASHNTTDDQDIDITQEIGPVIFDRGDIEKIVTITIMDDDRVESESKVFSLVLTRTGLPMPFIAVIEPSKTFISIEDNDVPTQVPTDDKQMAEGGEAIEIEEESQLTISCEEDYISVSFSLTDYPKADTSTAHLAEESCKPAEVSNEIVSFKFGLQACGTKKSKSSNGEYFVYKNAIKMEMKYTTPGNASITRSHNVVLPFKCSFKNKALVGSVSYNPRLIRVTTSTAAYGNFTYTMDMYRSERYEEVEEYPAVKSLGQTMYLQLKVDSGDTQLVLFPDWCKATLSTDYSSEPHHMIMEKTCLTGDNTLDFLYLPNSQQRFSLAAFRFTETYDDVYLHCQVTVCRADDTESRCSKGCIHDDRRKRRELSDEMAETLYVGPITLMNDNNAGAPAVSSSSSLSTVTLVALIAGLLALMVLILIVGLTVLVSRRRRIPSTGALLVQEE